MSISSDINHKDIDQIRIEEDFSLFWERCEKAAIELKINEPVLPRKRQSPSRYFLGEALSEFHDNVKRYYWQLYFESIDTVVNCVKSRFELKDYVNCYAKIERSKIVSSKR